MDGENKGKPYEQMDDLGVPLFLETPKCSQTGPNRPSIILILALRPDSQDQWKKTTPKHDDVNGCWNGSRKRW